MRTECVIASSPPTPYFFEMKQTRFKIDDSQFWYSYRVKLAQVEVIGVIGRSISNLNLKRLEIISSFKTITYVGHRELLDLLVSRVAVQLCLRAVSNPSFRYIISWFCPQPFLLLLE